MLHCIYYMVILKTSYLLIAVHEKIRIYRICILRCKEFLNQYLRGDNNTSPQEMNANKSQAKLPMSSCYRGSRNCWSTLSLSGSQDLDFRSEHIALQLVNISTIEGF